MSTPGVGQDIRVLGDQPVAPAEGNSRVTQLRGPNTDITGTSARQTPVNLGAPLQGVRQVTVSSAESTKTPAERMSDAIASCRDIVAGCDDSKDAAKVVYGYLEQILTSVKGKIGGDFSAESIGSALRSSLPDTPKIGMYQPGVDGTERKANDNMPAQKLTTHGLLAPSAWAKNPVTKKWVPVEGEQKKCLASLEKAGIDPISVGEKSRLLEDALITSPHPQNLAGCDFSKIPADELRHTFRREGTEKTTTYTWEADFKPRDYNGQLSWESNTFSGDVHIHKLEPGTVLVRVFGQGQSVKSACWARLDDDKSSVTCAQDLYKKLAVKAEWNGDGNLGVFIVPEGADIWVAEGKIASQAEKYTARVMQRSEKVRLESTFVYEGGGTQVNVLTPDKGELAGVFAGVDPEIFEQCMFCLRDDNIIKAEQFEQPVTQGE